MRNDLSMLLMDMLKLIVILKSNQKILDFFSENSNTQFQTFK